ETSACARLVELLAEQRFHLRAVRRAQFRGQGAKREAIQRRREFSHTGSARWARRRCAVFSVASREAVSAARARRPCAVMRYQRFRALVPGKGGRGVERADPLALTQL